MPPRHVTADLPLHGLVAGEFVLAHPGVRIDVVQRSEPWNGGTRVVLQVAGALEADLSVLASGLNQRYGNCQRLPSRAAGAAPRLVVSVAAKDVQSTAFRAISRFAEGTVLWWHVLSAAGHGVRIEVPTAAEASELAGRLTAFYQKLGVDVHAKVEPVLSEDDERLALARELARLLASHPPS